MKTGFREALLWHMERHGTTIAGLAEATGVSADTIKKIRTRPNASTKAEPAQKLAAFYGKSVAAFIRCQEEDEDQDIHRLADLLTADERRLLAAHIRAMLQLRGQR